MGDQSDDRVITTLKWFLMILIVLLGILVAIDAHCKELPLIVPIDELSDHDYERVAVEGWVRSIEQKQGIRGGNFLEIIVGDGDAIVTVFVVHRVFIEDAPVIVLGEYHKQGRFGAFLAENYIVAEYVERVWDDRAGFW
ncbi:MAG: hypothetical protein ACE5IR_27780 [bacterium]